MPNGQDSQNTEKMSYAELRKRTARGEMLAYNDATSEQLQQSRADLLDRVHNPRLESDIWLRDVMMNTVYAAVSIGTSLWFGAQNIVKNVPKVSEWLSNKGVLRNAQGEPYVANVTQFYREVTEIVEDWARMTLAKEPIRGSSPYEILGKAARLLDRAGFKDETGLIAKFLEENNHRKADVVAQEVEELGVAVRNAMKPGQTSMASRVLDFFEKATKSVNYSSNNNIDAEWVKARIQSRTNSLFDLHEQNAKIFNRRIAPPVVAATAIGAFAIGYGSWKAAREREAFTDSSELSHVERLLHDRQSQDAQVDHSIV